MGNKVAQQVKAVADRFDFNSVGCLNKPDKIAGDLRIAVVHICTFLPVATYDGHVAVVLASPLLLLLAQVASTTVMLWSHAAG